jgi:hypothetical protein
MLALARGTLLLFALSFVFLSSFSQDISGQQPVTEADNLLHLPSGLLEHIRKSSTSLDQKLTRQTERYIHRLQKQERRLRKELSRHDTTAAKNLFAGDPQQHYAALSQKVGTDSGVSAKALPGRYLPYSDTLQGTLLFLRANPGILGTSLPGPADAGKTLQQVQQLQNKFQDIDQVGQFMQQRKEQIRQYLSQYTHLPAGLTNVYTQYNKELYYYDAQIKRYKEEWNDPDKIQKEAMTALGKLPAFQQFMQKNSMLATLFGNTGTPDLSQLSSGLASRDQIQALIQSQIGAGGAGAADIVQQNIQSAQQMMDHLQDKLLSGGSGGADLPASFTPNEQKTLPFRKRLEYGLHLQNSPSTGQLPAISAIGLSLGYKLSDRATTGVGLSYRMGLGTDINHIRISNQGIGLQSFVDIKAKGSIWITGAYELNHQQAFSGINDLRYSYFWQPSALAGLTKKYKLGKKSGNLQLLYDFLANKDIPRQQPVKFRIGYHF